MMDVDDSSRGMSRVNIHDKRHIHHQNHTKCKNPSKQNKRRDGCHIISSIHDQRPKTSTPKVNVSPNPNKTRHPPSERPKIPFSNTKQKTRAQKAVGGGNHLYKCNSSTFPFESWIVSSSLHPQQQSSCLLLSSLREPFRRALSLRW